MAVNTKKCGKCKKIMAVEKFPKSSTTFDGYFGYCKKCKPQVKSEYHAPRKVPANIVRRAQPYSKEEEELFLTLYM